MPAGLQTFLDDGTLDLDTTVRTGRFRGQINITSPATNVSVSVPTIGDENVIAIMTTTDPTSKGEITVTATGFTYSFTGPGAATIYWGVM